MGPQTDDLHTILCRKAALVSFDVASGHYHSALYDARELLALIEAYAEAHYAEARREAGH